MVRLVRHDSGPPTHRQWKGASWHTHALPWTRKLQMCGAAQWRRFVGTQCERRILRRRLEGLELALEFIALVGQVQGNHVLGTCHTAHSFAELQQCSRREAGAHGNAQGRGRGQIRQIRRREHSVRPHAMYHSMTHFAASNRMRDQRSQRQVPGARRPPYRQVHL